MPNRAAGLGTDRATRADIDLGSRRALPIARQRTQRACDPLTRQTVAALRVWLADHDGGPADALFTTGAGRRLSRDAVAKMVPKHAASAAPDCPGIATKNVTPHTLRHSAAMALLHAGVDTSVIALWLGHEDPSSTQAYLHADMTHQGESPRPRSNHRTPAPGATGPQTPCSHSSTTSDPDRQARIMPTTRPRSPPSTSTVTPRSA